MSPIAEIPLERSQQGDIRISQRETIKISLRTRNSMNENSIISIKKQQITYLYLFNEKIK